MEIVNHKKFALLPLNGNAPEVLRQAHFLEVKYWLGGGTLLGLYRDGDFIPGDTDIDIEVEGFSHIDTVLKSTFEHMDLIRTVHHEGRLMQMAFIYRDVIFDIYVLWPNGNTMINHNDMGVMETPAHFYEDELGELKTQYGVFPCPSPLDDYLAVRYGPDWQTPARHKGLYTHAI